MCIYTLFIAVSARVFQGVHLQMCVEVLSRPRGSDTCVHIQLTPGANFNDHNTWIFKDAAQLMNVLDIILSHVGKK